MLRSRLRPIRTALPTGGYLASVTQNPQEVAAYPETLRALSKLELVITIGDIVQRVPVKIGADSATLNVKVS